MRHILHPRLILPFMIFIGVLTVGLRMGDIWHSVQSGKLVMPAFAQTASDAAKTETKTDNPAANADTAKPAADPAKAPDIAPPPPADTTSSDDVSPGEMELLKQLSDRRDMLDKRAKGLDQREALLKVAEQRVDQKLKEMQTLRLQLQAIVNQVSASQQAQINNLVKIYETMKPKDAAKIFETLDMPVLLDVIQRMKPKSTAPILAEMAPEKAKEVTVALTKQDQLPQLK